MSFYSLEFENWLHSDNVVKQSHDVYVEQTTQWKKKFSLSELKQFYIKEFNYEKSKS